MISSFLSPMRPLLSLCAALALASLTGCQGDKVVARIKSAPITEKELADRTMRFNSNLQGSGLDAGGTTLFRMMRELLVDQCAADKKLTPTPEAVLKMEAIFRRTQPGIADALSDGSISEEDLMRQVRLTMEEFAIGTDGAKAEDKDVQAEYDKQLKTGNLKYPETWTIRTLRANDEATAEQVLEQLKRTPDFAQAATRFLGATALSAITAGRESSFPVQSLPPALKEALTPLSPGQFAAKPILLPIPNQQTQTVDNAYIVAQLVKKQPEVVPKLEDIRPLLERNVIQNSHPQWSEHKEEVVAQYTLDAVQKGEVQINIKRYEKLMLAFQAAPVHTAVPPNTAIPSAPGGVPGGAAPPPAGGAPPAGSMTSPPPDGGKPTTP